MGRAKEKANWRFWRPQFSLRTLVIFVVLLGMYLACWQPTKRYGEKSIQEAGEERILMTTAIAPLVIASDEVNPLVNRVYVRPIGIVRYPLVRRYYLWCFGLRLRLPIESNCPSSLFAD